MTEFVPPSFAPRKSLLERLEDALLPLINLVFLLLMFFIVAGQLQNHSLPDLPGSATELKQDGPDADLVVLGSGQWQVKGEPAGEDNLARLLPSAEESPTLTIGAAGNTSMADLESLFALLAKMGFQDVLLMTEPSET
ncbi:biopolymer transporter ExbD [Marinobacter sp. CHS3-4]|uniref:ExbD/TolR family protein n=1 Tax=Marinobacter sp. CHS3-4 TaxID=3045174 RepID=UPI0024B5B87D|nr:biopolymer transporter ExbD [Marinobacter sp. CHS3-4]MDI9243641.1 biopolymer transporter ExbD [Marinobacter sp. CHS3-4]